MRARDLGIEFGLGHPGKHNAITDVPGVRVGHRTLISEEGTTVPCTGPVRTGVTVIFPHEGHPWGEPVFAGFHRLNGNGEVTGVQNIKGSGLLSTPIGLTNTHSVGIVRDALVEAEIRQRHSGDVYWSLPVVGETWDGLLNDINGLHIRANHVFEALASAVGGPVPEGNVGSGTGLVCHGFKGGVGTSSRRLARRVGGFTVGVLVQANQGVRERLRVDGVPVGIRIPTTEIPVPDISVTSRGSIIVVVATDAPLLAHQCEQVAQRAGLGVARVGGVGETWSGDLFVAFATGNRGLAVADVGRPCPIRCSVEMVSNDVLNAIFEAVVDATEEAIVNAMLAAETMTGRDGITVHRLDPSRLRDAMTR